MSDVVVESRGRVRWLRLNRPDRLNAFTWDTRDELLEALGEAQSGDFDAVVLTGSGRAFCAGVDIDAVLIAETDAPADARRRQLERTHDLLRLIEALPCPVVAAVNGVAAGGGWALAIATDFVVAVESARFVTAFAQLGLVPDLGFGYNLTNRVGAMRAKSIVMRGQAVSARDALAWGVVDALAASDALETEVTRLIPEIIARGKRSARPLSPMN